MPGRVVFGNEVEKIGSFVANGQPYGGHGCRFGFSLVEASNRCDDLPVISVVDNIIELGDLGRDVPGELLIHFRIGEKALSAISDVLSLYANELAVPIGGVGIMNEVAYREGIAAGMRPDKCAANGAGSSEEGDREHDDKRYRSMALNAAFRIVFIAP